MNLPDMHKQALSPSHFGQTVLKWIRRDWLVILLYLVATAIMTYPLAFRLDGEWLALWGIPANWDQDSQMKVWDIWWWVNRALDGDPLFYTRDLFYPVGVDLSYHSISWTVVLLSGFMTTIMDEAVAYNVTILIAVFTTGYAAYLMIYPLVKHQAAAWLGGLIYTFAPYHIAHSVSHPDLVHLASIPLAVLLITYALTRGKEWAGLAAGFMVGIAAFTSLYIMIFALLTMVMILPWLIFDKERWREKRLWSVILVFCISSGLMLAIRLAPIFNNPDTLGEVIETKYTAASDQTDLMAYLIPSPFNPIFKPIVQGITARFRMNAKWPAYLGLIPLILTGVALTWRRRRRQVLPWFIAGLVFVLLSLGPILRFNGQLYDSIRLPAAALSWFLPIRAVGRPDFFVIGVLLPLAVCAAYGLDRILLTLDDHRLGKIGLSLMCTGLLLLEFWNGSYPLARSEVNPYFRELAAEQGDFALIQLPMGREISKRYLYQQTVHQRPIVEGLAARTPEEAYRYIENNYLLDKWRGRDELKCTSETTKAIRRSLDQLVADGFRYVIVNHQGDVPDVYAAYLPVDPVYQDGEMSVYALADVHSNPPCSPPE